MRPVASYQAERHKAGKIQAPRSRTGYVGHVVPEYLPRSATFIFTLLRRQQRFQPIVLARRTTHLTEFPLDHVLSLEGESNSGARTLRWLRARVAGFPGHYEYRIAEEARRHTCALLHAHFGWSGPPALPAARSLELPLVTTFYGRDISEPQRTRFRNPYARLFAGGGLFMCEGPAMAIELASIGCPDDQIRLVPIGIDLERFPFSLRPRTRPLIIIQCSRLVEKKGVDLAIRSFAAARSNLGDSRLWIVGDGPLRAELEQLASRLGVGDVVRFHGMVTHDAFRRLAQSSHICVQPSRTASDGDTEGGAPIVLLEMQALGVPVVATRHADIPAVVPRPDDLVAEEDIDGLATAVVALAGLPTEELQGRAAEGRAFIEQRHCAEEFARTVEAVYDEALALA